MDGALLEHFGLYYGYLSLVSGSLLHLLLRACTQGWDYGSSILLALSGVSSLYPLISVPAVSWVHDFLAQTQ